MKRPKEPTLLLLIAAAAIAVVLLVRLKNPAACIAGDFRDYADGRIPAAAEARRWDAAAMRIGLGVAALDGWESLGDALVVDGRVYARSTRPGTRYLRLTQGNRFQTNAFLFLPREAKPFAQLTLERPQRLSELWARLADQHRDGVLAAGYLKLRKLQMIALARAPIEGRSLAHHAARYYTRALESADDRWVYAVAYVAPSAPRLRLLPKSLGGLVTAQSNARAHALTLLQPPAARERPPADDELHRVGQLLDATELESGSLALYSAVRVEEDCGIASAASDSPRPLGSNT